MPETNNPETELKSQFSQDLLQFYDEFAEFNDQCAFLSVALACILADEGSHNEHVMRGADCWSFWMRRRLDELQLKLRLLQKAAVAGLSE